MAISSSTSSFNPLITLNNHPPKPYLSNTKLHLNIKRNKLYVNKYSGYLKINSGLSILMCKTTPFIGFGGRFGLQRREENVSLLSFGGENGVNKLSGDDSNAGASQILSASLPFVVVATAIAALSHPSTFTW